MGNRLFVEVSDLTIERIRFEDLREAAFDQGFLRFGTPTGSRWVPISSVPNGLFLVEILRHASDLPPPTTG